MGDTLLDRAVPISVALLPPVVVTTGLGEVVLLTADAGSELLTSYSSATAIATALTDGDITAQAAEDMTAALSQTNSPARVWISTFDDDSEDPTDAADRAVDAIADIGVLVCGHRGTTDIAALGAWKAARTWIHGVVVAQSVEAALITATPPAGLDDFQVETAHLHYAADGEPQAAAHGGVIGGFDLSAGPIGARAQLRLVALPSLTSAEQVFADANDVNVLHALDKGASATERYLYGTTNYDGTSFKAAVTTAYTVKRCVAALKQLIASKGLTAEPITADESGLALVDATLNAPLAALAAVGHYTPGTSGVGASAIDLPDGYRVSSRVVGDDIVADITIRLGREAKTISLNVTGEVI